jgi:hypothetical protein
MWRGKVGEVEYLVNVMWAFTPYRRENGATLIWPESHGHRALEADVPASEFAVELEPGSALLFLGSTLHGAGGNASQEVRRGAIVSYCLGWLKPYENQWLGNFEGRCPSVLLGPEHPARLGAIDALRPDQEALVAEFVAGQDWAPGRRAA